MSWIRMHYWHLTKIINKLGAKNENDQTIPTPLPLREWESCNTHVPLPLAFSFLFFSFFFSFFFNWFSGLIHWLLQIRSKRCSVKISMEEWIYLITTVTEERKMKIRRKCIFHLFLVYLLCQSSYLHVVLPLPSHGGIIIKIAITKPRSTERVQ